MKKLFLALLIICSKSAFSQADFSVPWAMFHACEKHCGMYPSKNYPHFGSTKWKFSTKGKIFSSPAVFEGIAYIGSEDKNLYAIDVVTGKERWKFTTEGAVHSSPAVYKNVVYFGSYDGFYYALDKNTGKLKWKFQTGGEKHYGQPGLWGMQPAQQFMDDPFDFYLSSPVINMDDNKLKVYFGSSDGNLYALDAESGKLSWKYPTRGIIHTTPTIYKGKVFIGSWDTYMYALDAEYGKEIWKFKTGDQPDVHLLEGIQASVTVDVDEDAIYFGARDAYFYALDLTTGNLKWKFFNDNSWVLSSAGVKD
ncbi:MAG: outer membrane protein assembly factor BamB, contains PQQ-like beta-propeller repeat, partial [Daejeonella sp.]|nr:outer membrane protein assembly factor BamB, contains PQQ-like beta-propeller repeat [Daejeonella sp.]